MARDPFGPHPHASRRLPVHARNVVAASQPLAAQAGLDALREGGNAIDAALAAAITLTVVEPTGNGIGSDAFAIVWDGERIHGINGSGRSPRAWTPERFRGRRAVPELGWDSVTVPGAVDVWRALSERFGDLPFERLFAPAIGYAREGFAVGPVTAFHWARAVERFADFASFRETFLPRGRAPRAGELFRCPDQADTLESIAATGGESFYRGEIAARIVEDARAHGGALSEDDLATHASQWVEPIARDYRGVALHEIPPNGQGLAALVALGVASRLGFENSPAESSESVHLLIEAMKAGFAEADRHVGDPDRTRIDPSTLITDELLERAAARIDPRRASHPVSRLASERGTVTLAAADGAGRMVSFIQSNFWGFGSGVVIPGTGISLQNRALGFTLERDHPNEADGGKRPFHTILPALVTRDGQAEMAFGLMGGAMQPQGHLQMMARIYGYGENLQAAADAPRWFVERDGTVALEAGFPAEVRDGLEARGHTVTEGSFGLFGGAQLVRKTPAGYEGASDWRKEGQAVGF